MTIINNTFDSSYGWIPFGADFHDGRVDLPGAGNQFARVSQLVYSPPGDVTISVDAVCPSAFPWTSYLEVTLGGVTHQITLPCDSVWRNHSFTFDYQGGASYLSFASNCASIDNVTTVPEQVSVDIVLLAALCLGAFNRLRIRDWMRQ